MFQIEFCRNIQPQSHLVKPSQKPSAKASPYPFLSRNCNSHQPSPKMAWRSAGSLSRSLISSARVSAQRSAPSLPRLRPPNVAAPPRRLSFSSPSIHYGFLLFGVLLLSLALGRIGMHAVSSADRCGCNLFNFSFGCQRAGFLRAVSWYLPSFLSRSLIVSLYLRDLGISIIKGDYIFWGSYGDQIILLGYSVFGLKL
ncbi:hypothetical protein G4B88_011326 [Cannabis sativa]|uniref:Uncharacterized protein n=1 Tax=Cannabis sativa TaxID=3483 RepID=A0A7J6GHH6_CANSA|nr:hypothetical protein G4B88_011326 [Cannabis sativa]